MHSPTSSESVPERFHVKSLIPSLSDVSWGTKGDNKVSTDLGVVDNTKSKGNSVDLDVPTDVRDIDASYEEALLVLSTKPPKEEPKKDANQDNSDYYASFRTKCVVSFSYR